MIELALKGRRMTNNIYVCGAPDSVVYTEEWCDIPPEHQKIIEDNGGLECDGKFIVGWWCIGCPYYQGPTEGVEYE